MVRIVSLSPNCKNASCFKLVKHKPKQSIILSLGYLVCFVKNILEFAFKPCWMFRGPRSSMNHQILLPHFYGYLFTFVHNKQMISPADFHISIVLYAPLESINYLKPQRLNMQIYDIFHFLFSWGLIIFFRLFCCL